MTKFLCRYCSNEVEPVTIALKKTESTVNPELEGYRCSKCGLLVACECHKYLEAGICSHILSSLVVCTSECD